MRRIKMPSVWKMWAKRVNNLKGLKGTKICHNFYCLSVQSTRYAWKAIQFKLHWTWNLSISAASKPETLLIGHAMESRWNCMFSIPSKNKLKRKNHSNPTALIFDDFGILMFYFRIVCIIRWDFKLKKKNEYMINITIIIIIIAPCGIVVIFSTNLETG